MKIAHCLLGVFFVSGLVVTFPALATAQQPDRDDPNVDTQSQTDGRKKPTEPPAPEPKYNPPEEHDPVEEITIVGSRRQTRSKMDTMAPVDVIDISNLKKQGAADMSDMLRTFVPAYNVNQQPISDAATLVRPTNLRGLPPDMTVVLVNGKRRHRASVISFIGGGVSDGSQGVDVSVIPSIALSRVEVLRDGAAAQYGADAIAGVINFVLKDSADGLNLQTQYGKTYTGDGASMTFAGNWGMPFTEHGFINFSAEYSTTDPTSRSVQRADAAELRAQGNLAVRDPAQIWGGPEVSDNVKLFANVGFDVGEKAQTYLFGNYAHRFVLGGFYYRNPDAREGVFVYKNESGDLFRLVGDLNPDDGVTCPIVPVGDDALLSEVMENPECFVFNELYRGGFTPQFGGDVEDLSLVGGVKGILDSGLRWDLSAGVGQNQVTFLIKNTVNASLGPKSPTQFTPGAYRQTDQNFNFDLVYPISVDFLQSPINVAGGIEYREEKFVVSEGDRKSFEIGPLFDQGFSIGSNGFPGFSTDQAGSFTRRNTAGYLDLEADVLSDWIIGLAGRVEHFDTFGTTATAKLSTRIKIIDDGIFIQDLSLRSTVGSGFRAPTPGQANVSNVTTMGYPDGRLINRGTIPPTNPIARSKGGKELQPERAINAGGGLVLNFLEHLTVTADFYYIKVKDRISQSATMTLTPEEALALEKSGVRGASDLGEFRFYTNAFDTTTQGADVIGSFKYDWAYGAQSRLSLAYNWNKTSVDSYIPGVINDQRILELSEYLPRHRFVISASHAYDAIRLLARLNYYGDYKDPETSGDYNYAPKLLADLEIGYTLDQTLTLVVGAHNIFNTFPDRHMASTNTGNKYPQNSPAGTNGGFWYTRLEAHF